VLPGASPSKIMTQVSTNISVAVTEQTAFIKVTGRAGFSRSICFKTLVKELNDRGYSNFVLDLGECATMDSTFLGSLVGIVSSFPQRHQTSTKICLQLLNPSQRIQDLLENLGVDHLFPIRQDAPPAAQPLPSEPADPGTPSKKQVSKACLEAHQHLMAVNPENIPRFKDVVEFLAEDLKKQQP
jgi:anti-sigma B factor antagonist